MIDLFAALNKKGYVLFHYNPLNLILRDVLDLLNEFIQCALIDQNNQQPLNLKMNRLCQYAKVMNNVVLVAIYPKDLPQLDYVPILLEKCKLYIEIKSHPTERMIDGFDETVFTELLEVSEQSEGKSFKEEQIVSSKKPTEKVRKWGLDKEELKALDYSKPKSLNNPGALPLDKISKELEELAASKTKPAKPNLFWAAIQSVAGGKSLDAAALCRPLKLLQEHLVSKNVAPPVASIICQKVQEDLAGSKTSAFSTLKSIVESSAEKAIKTLIASESASHFLAQIRGSSDGPYVLAFVGVNGVGKSTSLAKVAAWLLANDQSILLVAADTFRAGAVEQLAKHAKNLTSVYGDRVTLFEKGYGRDAAQVAEAAVHHARAQGIQVVLIDTAGRMPTNSQLMRALGDLVTKAKPNKVIFVGEALAGNEALVQLSHFNAAMEPRKVDALLITKYDTVDDKVGAVLNMCHTAHAPILFVGSGQTFGDLKTLSPLTVIQLLLQ